MHLEAATIAALAHLHIDRVRDLRPMGLHLRAGLHHGKRGRFHRSPYRWCSWRYHSARQRKVQCGTLLRIAGQRMDRIPNEPSLAHGQAQKRRWVHVHVCQRAFLLRVHLRPHSLHGHSPDSQLPGAATVQYFPGSSGDLRVRSAVDCLLNRLVRDPAVLGQTNLRCLPPRSQRREAQDWQKRRLNKANCLGISEQRIII